MGYSGTTGDITYWRRTLEMTAYY